MSQLDDGANRGMFEECVQCFPIGMMGSDGCAPIRVLLGCHIEKGKGQV